MNFMKKNKRTMRYDDNFRNMIIQQYYSGDSVKDLSIKYGVSDVSIYRWISKSDSSKTKSINYSDSDCHLALKKRVSELQKENDILKKAMIILSKDKKDY